MDKKLVALGAECVAGDLILNRETVGTYRHGQFTLTAAGEAALKAAEDAKQTADAGTVATEAPAAPKPKPTKAPKAAKQAAAPAEAQADTSAETPTADTPAADAPAEDDLTAGLDELLS